MSSEYFLFDSELIDILGLKAKFEINENCTPEPPRNYTTFKSLEVYDVNNLRSLLFVNKSINSFWSEKILRYTEIWLFKFDKRLKLNYQSSKDRMLFKQYIISLLLEIAYSSDDMRYLNAALKIMYSSKGLEVEQYIYNKRLADLLIKNI